ncbi:MAG: hypothetical protein NWF00_02985 [Candidatus Bathyarchaeota archaeon]|nr:hypothetical protein [Candidatus Bathyarchaeota archaeon]
MTIQEILYESAFRVFTKIAFRFEPLAPTAITFFINQRLSPLRDSGKIGNYKTKTRRLGRFHYIIEVDLDLTGKQAVYLMDTLLPERYNFLRRWGYE